MTDEELKDPFKEMMTSYQSLVQLTWFCFFLKLFKQVLPLFFSAIYLK